MSLARSTDSCRLEITPCSENTAILKLKITKDWLLLKIVDIFKKKKSYVTKINGLYLENGVNMVAIDTFPDFFNPLESFH